MNSGRRGRAETSPNFQPEFYLYFFASMLGDMEKGNGYAQRGWLVFHTPWEWIEGGRHDKSAALLEQIAAAIVANKKREEHDAYGGRETEECT